jgi:four helix bundle protein
MRFEDLDVWKRSKALCVEIYRHLASLKDFGFKDQITRSALSIPSNIAEGFERGSQKETILFLMYAKGSCGELKTQIMIGVEIGYIHRETGTIWQEQAQQLSNMLGGLVPPQSEMDFQAA